MKHSKLFALLLAAAMLLALASCGGAPAASDSPSPSQSEAPSESPSEKPSEEPSENPSEDPSEAPSEEPSENPSEAPSEEPSENPSETPSDKPSEKPSESPSEKPSEKPSESPLPSPTDGKDLVEMGVLPTPKPSTEPAPSASSSPASSQGSSVNLQKFYEDLLAKYEDDDFNPNMAVKGDFLTSYYGGLAGIGLEQQVIYQPMMSAVVCEIALAEVKNAADVQKVKDVFQERIDAQVGTDDAPGGAFYPGSIEGWKNNSRIVSNGNFVMLIVWEDCDKVVDDFNALF